MATALMMSHHGLRRDIACFAQALRRPVAGQPFNAAALQEEWQSYRATLHGHHQAEDERLFPHLSSQNAALTPVIAQLTADHRRIDPLLERGDRAFADLPVGLAAAVAVVSELSALLDAHLAIEEAQVIPFLRAAKEFPPPASDEEAALYAQGFAWSSHGVAPEVLGRLNQMLPEILISRLPAARAAFAQRCQRVWGSAKTGASRTSVPDWLALGQAEAQLRAAMLGNDVATLARLLHDDLAFTGPDGATVGKQDDLAAHAARRLQLTRLDLEDQQIEIDGALAVVTVRATLVGTFDGRVCDGSYRYTRTWRKTGDEQWQIIAGQVSLQLP